MRIEELEIRGRGPWEELSLSGLDAGMNVIYGRNEAGKTSLLAALRSLLHGGETGLPLRRGERPTGGAFRAAGNVAGLANGASRFAVYRALDDTYEHSANGQKNGIAPYVHEGEPPFLMVDSAGGRLEALRYDDFLAGVDRRTYDNIFACGLKELQQLSTLEDGEVSRLLHDLTAGLDRVSLADVLRQVRNSRNELMDPEGGESRLGKLLAEHRELTRDIDRLSDSTEEYNRRLNERDSLAARISEIEAELATADHRISLLRASDGVQNAWTEQTRLRAELDGLDEYRSVPPDGPRRLEVVTRKLAKLARQLRDLRAKRRATLEELKKLPDAGKLALRAPEIEALSEQGELISAMEQQSAAQQAAVRDLERQLQATLDEMGIDHETWQGLAASFDRRSFEKLRPLVKNLDADREAVDVARQAAIDAKRQAAEVTRQSLQGGPSLTERKEQRKQAQERAAQLRRRLQLDERLKQLEEDAAALEDDSTQLAAEQGLSNRQMIGLGVVFTLGIVLVLGTLLLPESIIGTSWWPFFLGLLFLGGAYGGKVALQKLSARKLEEAENELDAITQEIEQANKQREAFDRDLSREGGTIEERLAAAEAKIVELDQSDDREANRETIEQAAADAEAVLNEAQAQFDHRKETWHKALRTFGLPHQMTPKQVGRLRTEWDHAREISDRLDRAITQANQGETSRSGLRQRIEDLALDLDIELTEDNAAAQLTALRRELERQKGSLRQRSAFKLQLRKLDRNRKKLKSSLAIARRKRRSILTLAGAADEADLQRRCGEAQRRTELVARLAELKERIDSSLAQVSRDEVISRLREFGVTGVSAELQELQHRADRLRGELQTLYDRRGWLSQALPEMLTDASLPQALLRREIVDQQIRGLLRQWRVLATVHFLLNRIRARYEQERQPETLREASGYFRMITEGAYLRVWTPLDEDVLYVENDRGENLSPAQLSGGTREQLFLALRLALVASYARHGIKLPVVLDDVLVNFDARRARAAASVLAEFAAHGHQVLIFTCHEHIARMFAELKVRVWRLSRHINLHRERSLIDEILGALPTATEPLPVMELPAPLPLVVDELGPPLVILDEAPAEPESPLPLADEPLITGFIVDPAPTRHAFDAEEFDGELQDEAYGTDENVARRESVARKFVPRQAAPADQDDDADESRQEAA